MGRSCRLPADFRLLPGRLRVAEVRQGYDLIYENLKKQRIMKKFLLLCVAAVLAFTLEASADNKQKTQKCVTAVFATDIECEHCKKKIMDNVPVLGKGVESVEVDVPTKRVTVTYNPAKTDADALVKGFAKLRVKAERVEEQK